MSIRHLIAGVSIALLLSACHATPHAATGYDTALSELKAGVPVADLQAHMKAGKYTSADLTQAALDQIKAKNGELHAVITVNPDALKRAKESDEARKTGKYTGPLMGIPILIKDNIETADIMPTTAGSMALVANISHRDAPVVARLRAGGAIILGKTNLSEWANIRSTRSVSGWSGVGGLTANAVDHVRTACGSSSGSGAGVAAGLAPLAVGTETDGSITCPSSMNGLVGLKPTVGLVSRTWVVPISHSQDTPGPMGRRVADIAAMLTVMAGSDPADKATAEADARKTDYTAHLAGYSLKGVSIGVLRDQVGNDAKTVAVFEAALKQLTQQGAVLVDIRDSSLPNYGNDELAVMMYELKAGLNAYLASTPAVVKTRTLADVIAFNKANAAQEMPYFGQELFEQAEATKGLTDPVYLKAAAVKSRAAKRLDGLMADNNVTVLVAPTYGPAWLSDLVYGDQYSGPSSTSLPAISGYPHLTVPMGTVQGLPVGLSFIGPKWSEEMLLQTGYAFERTRQGLK